MCAPQAAPGHAQAEQVLRRLATTPSIEIVEQISMLRNRPCDVVTFNPAEHPDAPCGAWLECRDRDVLVVSETAQGFYRDHVLAHELSHILLGHQADDALAQMLDAALPDISPNLIKRILGRHTYTDPQERDAETLASRILAGTRGQGRSSWINDPVLRRAAETMAGVR